jgi:hypothetical protein
MLQSWNRFCFTCGYIKVAVTLPGPDKNTRGYVSVCPSFQLVCVVGWCSRMEGEVG